jgi:hypothetical protein
MTPWLAALARRRPDQAKPTSASFAPRRRPSSMVLPRPIPKKEKSATAATSTSPSFGQQPPPRPAGSSGSLSSPRSMAPPRLARVRTTREANGPSLIDDPVPRCVRPPPPRPGEADIIIVGRADHPSAIVRPRICEQQSAKTNWRRRRRRPHHRAASSRCTTPGGPSRSVGIAPPSLSRARVHRELATSSCATQNRPMRISKPATRGQNRPVPPPTELSLDSK